MRLWIGLHLPNLPLEVFTSSCSEAAGCVVLEQERVLAVSELAAKAGIRPGMRRSAALMLMPDASIYDRSHSREAEALQAVAMALLQYTPLVTQAEESTLLLDIGASLRLFGGIRRLCERVRRDLRVLGFTASLSCAPTARGAWLLARAGAGRSLKMDRLHQRLNALPCLLLPPTRPFATWLDGIGCHTIGELRRLPRPGLQRRCGRALLDMVDSAFGMNPELFEWIEPPTTFAAKLELFDRIENAELLLSGAQRLIVQMTGWLCARQLGAEQVTLFLEHERGKTARPPTPVEISLSEPTWQGEHLVRLLRERLSKLVLDAPVIGIALEAVKVHPITPPSEDLFPEPGGGAEDQAKMLEVLVARLGANNVLQAAPRADYRPEEANNWVSIEEKVREGVRAAQMPPDGQDLLRPSWLLAKPIPLLMRDHRPWYTSPLRMVSGPERVEAGWWDSGQVRDYFIAEGEDHVLYWLYLERIIGEDGVAEPKWFLHGLFG